MSRAIAKGRSQPLRASLLSVVSISCLSIVHVLHLHIFISLFSAFHIISLEPQIMNVAGRELLLYNYTTSLLADYTLAASPPAPALPTIGDRTALVAVLPHVPLIPCTPAPATFVLLVLPLPPPVGALSPSGWSSMENSLPMPVLVLFGTAEYCAKLPAHITIQNVRKQPGCSCVQ
jgi:hypothetical protein